MLPHDEDENEGSINQPTEEPNKKISPSGSELSSESFLDREVSPGSEEAIQMSKDLYKLSTDLANLIWDLLLREDPNYKEYLRDQGDFKNLLYDVYDRDYYTKNRKEDRKREKILAFLDIEFHGNDDKWDLIRIFLRNQHVQDIKGENGKVEFSFSTPSNKELAADIIQSYLLSHEEEDAQRKLEEFINKLGFNPLVYIQINAHMDNSTLDQAKSIKSDPQTLFIIDDKGNYMILSRFTDEIHDSRIPVIESDGEDQSIGVHSRYISSELTPRKQDIVCGSILNAIRNIQKDTYYLEREE